MPKDIYFGLTVLCALIIFANILRIIYTMFRIGRIRKAMDTPFKKILQRKGSLEKGPQAVELKGTVTCEEPIFSPFMKEETVFYEFRVSEFYTITGKDNQFDSQTKVLHHSKSTAKFRLTNKNDSIPVLINANVRLDPTGEQEHEFKGPQKIDGIVIKYRDIPADAIDYGYEYLENLIPVNSQIHFIGEATYKDEIFHLESGDITFIRDISEEEAVYYEKKKIKSGINWILFTLLCSAVTVMGYLGKPEKVAQPLRRVVMPVVEVLQNLGVVKKPEEKPVEDPLKGINIEELNKRVEKNLKKENEYKPSQGRKRTGTKISDDSKGYPVQYNKAYKKTTKGKNKIDPGIPKIDPDEQVSRKSRKKADRKSKKKK